MGVETVTREVDVRQVRCDLIVLDAGGTQVSGCDRVTTEFLPGVDDTQGGPVLLDATWLQLRTGGIKQWYFCSHGHLLAWVSGVGADVLNTGVQPLSTLRTRSMT